MKSPHHAPDSALSRREALRRTLLGGFGVGTATMLPQVHAAPPVVPETPFVPENDYPFFGGDLPVVRD